MKKINKLTDFTVIVNIPDNYKDNDWKIVLQSGNVIEASYINGEYTNVIDQDGTLVIVCRNHNFTVGKLKYTFYGKYDNEWASDLNVCIPSLDDIMIVNGKSDGLDDIQIDVIADYIKGEKGDKGDSISITNVQQTDNNNIITFSDGTTITVKNGSNGLNGKDGVDGKDGMNGTNGKDGIKGDKGDKGDKLTFADLTADDLSQIEQPIYQQLKDNILGDINTILTNINGV